MLKKHLCPCCSQPLLRHVSCRRTFWFCNHCFQEMPDLEGLRDAQLTRHWLSKTITQRQQLLEELPQREKLNSGLTPKKELVSVK